MSRAHDQFSKLPGEASYSVGTRGRFHYTEDHKSTGWLPQIALAWNYVSTSSKKDRRSVCVGIITIALVVGFTSLLMSAINSSPVIFLKLAEDQTGEVDFLLMPSEAATVAGDPGPGASNTGSALGISFLNSTDVDFRLQGNPNLAGVAPRWLMLGSLLNRDNPLLNTSTVILVIDSKKEEEIGLGRNWDKRPLGEQEAYVTTTALSEIGVQADLGQRFIMNIDVLGLLSQLGGGIGDIDPDDPEAIVNLLEEGGVDLSTPVDVDTGAAIDGLDGLLPGIDLSGITGGTLSIDPSAVVAGAYPAIRAATIINQELIALGEITDPAGKWAPLLGNVVVIDQEYAAQIIHEAMDNILTLVETLGTGNGASIIPGLPTGVPILTGVAGIADFRTFVDGFTAETMSEYAMQVNVQMKPERRDDIYYRDQAGQKQGLAEVSDSVALQLGVGYPAAISTPLSGSLTGLSFLQLFIDQIFNVVTFMLGLLGVLVIYALVLGDVEAKTYEYGMLRALGLRHTGLTAVLAVQAIFFSIPGVLIGLFVASVLNVAAMLAVSILSGSVPPLVLHRNAWLLAFAMGVLMPALANIVPVRRALTSVLRDALDMYHKTFADVSVTMRKLEEAGLSLAQLALSVCLIVIGLVTFVLLPVAFTRRNFGLFLGILNAILVGMVLGLSIISQALQPAFEDLVMRALIWGPDRRMQNVVKKNLNGHRPRNRKTAYMVSLFVAFVLFAGTMFSLQTTSIANTVKMAVGADILVLSPTRDLALPQAELATYLETASQPTPQGPALVADYTFLTFGMGAIAPARSARFGNLAALRRPRSNAFGIQRNLLNVGYTEFVSITESVPLAESVVARIDAEGGNAADLNIVEQLVDGAGTLSLPIEAGAQFIAPVAVHGPVFLQRAECNITGTSYTLASQCLHNCDGGICSSLPVFNATELGEAVQAKYTDYVDVIMSEAQRVYSSVDTQSPLRLQVNAEEGVSRVFMAKARAMAAKMPAFFFSTYSQSSQGAPLLMPMEEFGRVLLDAQEGVLEQQQIDTQNAPDPPNNDETTDSTAPSATITTTADAANGTWFQSSPLWVSVTDPRYVSGNVAADSNTTLALDNKASTQLTFTVAPTAAQQPWFAWDTGTCIHTTGFRVYGSGTVGDVRRFALEASASIGGPWTRVAEAQVGSDEEGAGRQWYEFGVPSQGFSEAFATRYWRMVLLDNYGWTAGTVVVDVQMRGTVQSCTAPVVIDEASLFIPKQRLLVKMNPAADSPANQQRVINSMRSLIDSDLITVQDTATLLSSADTANMALQVFFNVVAALCIVLSFFASWVSFHSNVMENSRELGVLRALGLTARQVERVFIYEALSVVLSSVILGTAVGLLVSMSLTLQFNLFTEMPFAFSLPTVLAVFTFASSILLAVISSYYPAKHLNSLVIANVLSGKTK